MIDAFKNGDIESMSAVSSQNAEILKNESKLKTIRAPLPRIFGVFFNQNHAPVLANKEIREALSEAIDKSRMVKEVLNGYGIEIDSPIPPDLIDDKKNSESKEDKKQESAAPKTEKALSMLQNKGWKMNEEEKILEKKFKNETQQLRFSISTSNTPSLKRPPKSRKKNGKNLGPKLKSKFLNREI